jgi:hypothetical protein
MGMLPKNLSVTFAAGCLGGLANSLVLGLFVIIGITEALGVHFSISLTQSWLYPRLVWGGLWGFLFLLPFKQWSFLARGLLFSLAPTLVQLVIVFPMMAHKGLFGLQLGYLTPVFVLFFNAVWGLVAAWWLKLLQYHQ